MFFTVTDGPSEFTRPCCHRPWLFRGCKVSGGDRLCTPARGGSAALFPSHLYIGYLNMAHLCPGSG